MPNWESAQQLLASGAQTATGAGAAVDLGTRDRLLRQVLAITAVSGTTPSLVVRLECSADGVAGWRTFATFAAATAIAVEKLTSISPERFARVAWTITGTTPSFTFGVTGNKGIAYANLEDLDTHGIPGRALSSRTPHQKCEAIAAASETADGKLGLVKDLPLAAWGVDLTKVVCKIATYEEVSARGFNPDDASDKNFLNRYNQAHKWLSDVADNKVKPVGMIDSTPTIEDDGVIVVTTPSRGWR